MNTQKKILVLLSVMFFMVMAIYAASGVTVTLIGRGNSVNYAPKTLPAHYFCDGAHSFICKIEVTVEK